MERSFHSAVVIIPPERVWSRIQNIRRGHDKGYTTWMPHINLMFPFVADVGNNFTTVTDTLSSDRKFNSVKPFKIRFTKDSFSYFDHGKRCTIHLKPLRVAENSSRNSSTAPRNPSDELVTHKKHEKADKSPITMLVPSNELSFTTTLPIPREFQGLPAASMDSLAMAVWGEPTIPELPSGSVGLECLKHAIWTPEDTKCVKHTNNAEHPTPAPGLPHKDIIKLQLSLVSLYPEFTDQNSKSAAGYQPHLTLGQCDTRHVDRVMAQWKQNWVDIEFDVGEVHLISRKPDTAHVIRQTVPFSTEHDY